MIYKMYKLSFLNGIHIGKNNLHDAEMTICADTFFSAVCHEIIKKGKEEFNLFIEKMFMGKIVFSDLLPYCGEIYYIPKPVLKINNNSVQTDLSLRKAYKKLSYIPINKITEYINGTLDVLKEESILANEIGKKDIRTCASINDEDETMPFRVGTYNFIKGSGLYILVGFDDVKDVVEFDECMTALGYSGIGGKRRAGLGRFTWKEGVISCKLQERLTASFDKYVALSCSLPDENELENAVSNGGYLLTKRSGFVSSETYSNENRKKKDVYLFQSGACFDNKFSGCIIDVSTGGEHPVYRYARPMFMGVNL